MESGLKYTDIKLQTLQDKVLILFLENNIRGGISSVLEDRYVKSDDNKKVLYIDANDSYGHSLSQPLPSDEIKFERNVKFKDILNTPDESRIGYFVDVVLSYPNNIRQKTTHSPFAPENKKFDLDGFSDYMKIIKPDTCAQTKN